MSIIEYQSNIEKVVILQKKLVLSQKVIKKIILNLQLHNNINDFMTKVAIIWK